VPTIRYSGNAPASHCGGLGLVPGQSVRMCEDETSLQQVFRRVFRFSRTGTRKTPTMLRTRFHLYRHTSERDKQTKPGGQSTKITLFRISESMKNEKYFYSYCGQSTKITLFRISESMKNEKYFYSYCIGSNPGPPACTQFNLPGSNISNLY